jgi:hypothetical protein
MHKFLLVDTLFCVFVCFLLISAYLYYYVNEYSSARDGHENFKAITSRHLNGQLSPVAVVSDQASNLINHLKVEVNDAPVGHDVSGINIQRAVEYGSPLPNKFPKRTPVVMIRSKLSPAVYERMLQLPMFTCNITELEDYKMHEAVDYPQSRATHFYHEGYFHSLLSREPILSRNPRSGAEFQKPPIDLFLSSFYESLRRVNDELFERLRNKLLTSALEREPIAPTNDVCGVLASWLGRGHLFGDLSVQVHYGSHIGGSELFWHCDAENSLLHFAITIRGTRTLHSKRSRTETGTPEDVLEEQRAGDVYLSSSSLMNHAPEYPETTWDTRIVAIQARILYNTTDLKSFRKLRTDAGWMALTNILSSTLSTADFRIPSIEQVEEVLKEGSE